jgi:predicted NBD/HSP70 family sugar kinase
VLIDGTAHLPHWCDEPVRDRLAARFSLPVAVDNDANCAALAEGVLGAARGARVSLTVTVGTGVGMGLVVDGRLHHGARGGAGELGHLPLGSGEVACECGIENCVEPEMCGSGLVESARRRGLAVDDAEAVFALAAAGDAVAAGLVERLADRLGAAIATAVNLFDPEVVAIGGGGARGRRAARTRAPRGRSATRCRRTAAVCASWRRNSVSARASWVPGCSRGGNSRRNRGGGVMAELKTKVNTSSVAKFLERCRRREAAREARMILALMKQVTKLPPKMWGTAIVGFGSYIYRYSSGREGTWPLAAFSPRKDLTLYITGGTKAHADLLARLGRHKRGGSCLYLPSLDDVDLAVLRQIVKQSVALTRKKWGATAVAKAAARARRATKSSAASR